MNFVEEVPIYSVLITSKSTHITLRRKNRRKVLEGLSKQNKNILRYLFIKLHVRKYRMHPPRFGEHGSKRQRKASHQ